MKEAFRLRNLVVFAVFCFVGGAVFSLGAALLGWGLAPGQERAGSPGLASTAEAQTIPAYSGLPGETDSGIPEIVERVSPAVVTVGAIRERIVYQPYQRDFFSPFFLQPRALREKMPYLGSGFLIDKQGHIITNYHVVEGSQTVLVTFTDGREVEAQKLDADPYVDVALLKVDIAAEELPDPIPLGTSEALRIGEVALAVGNPFGNFIADPNPSVTAGVVSALHRSFRPDQAQERVYLDMIQTDAAINPGNSGGPLIDRHGEVIGVNTFIFSGGGGSDGIGFAIPVDRVKAFVDEIKEFGRLRPLLIDFWAQTVRSERFRGVMVSWMVEDGPAEEAGLEVGDIILAVDGRAVTSDDEFRLLLKSKQVGDELELKVTDGKETRTVAYTITEAPEDMR
jgi:serine protease Do